MSEDLFRRREEAVITQKVKKDCLSSKHFEVAFYGTHHFFFGDGTENLPSWSRDDINKSVDYLGKVLIFISSYRLLELVELMSPRKISNPEELECRQSGSVAWRMSRGEMGSNFQPTTWKLTETEMESLTFHLEYDIIADEYIRPSNGNEVTKGWRTGLQQCQDIIRKEELDWGQIYLARAEGTSKSSLAWEIDLSDSNLSVKSIELDVNSETFENGRVLWQVCGGTQCLLPMSGKLVSFNTSCLCQYQIRVVWLELIDRSGPRNHFD